MSYALTLRHGRLTLGAETTFDFAAQVATKYTSNKTSASASATAKPEPPKLPDCKDAAVTGNEYIDKTAVECCYSVKKRWGSSVSKQAEGLAECTARAASTAACVAAGAVTFGITTLVAPLCGDVGAFIAERVMGYDALQLGAGIVAGAICGVMTGGTAAIVCGIVAAELVGWLTDTVGPLISAILDPGAAKRRELAARAAYKKAIEANEKACREADEKYRLAWGMGIGSLKELYRKAFPTAALQAKAKKALGFGPTYDEIARAMGQSGAAAQPGIFSQNKGKKGCYGQHPDWECPGCEQFDYVKSAKYADPQWKGTPWEGITAAWVVEGRKDPWSDVCPFSIEQFYLAERQKALGPSPKRDAVTAWEKKFAPTIAAVANQIYPAMVMAISVVGSKITSVAVALKQQELLESANTASREQLAARVASAASRAEVAADLAKKGTAKEAKLAIIKASQQYDIAAAAYQKLLFEHFGGKPTSSGAAASQAIACQQDPNCKRATASLARARVAKTNAPLFAAQTARNRLLIGGAVGAAAIGAAYYFTR